MSTQGDHPVYPNPSVTHVVLEVRFPSTTTDLTTAESALRKGLGERFPLADWTAAQSVVIDLGAGASKVDTTALLQFQSRDRTQTVIVAPDAVTIETSEYLGLEWYLDMIRSPIEVVAQSMAPAAVLAMGHRFIDEIRIPAGGPDDWSHLLDPALFAASGIAADAGVDPPLGWQGTIAFNTSEESTLTLRHGPMNGAGVVPNGVTRRREQPPPGPYFLLDWDSRWTPRTAPEFDAEAIIARCADLYAPVRSMFHHLVSSELVQVFANSNHEGTP